MKEHKWSSPVPIKGEVYVYCDGGARGNPGPGGIGIVFCDSSGNVIDTHKEFVGHVTNNEAEYSA